MPGWIPGFPAILVILGALISAIGAVWLSTQQAAKSEEIAALNREIAAKSNRIAELNERIASKSEEIAGSVMGGDSFCYLMLEASTLKSGAPLLILVHQGKYPLYDVSVRITDVEKFNEIMRVSGPNFEQLQSADTYFKAGNLFPAIGQVLGRWSLPQTQSQRYNIFIVARNGATTELLRLRKVNDEWKQATRVTRDTAGKSETLYERVDADYPRDGTGQVDWK